MILFLPVCLTKIQRLLSWAVGGGRYLQKQFGMCTKINCGRLCAVRCSRHSRPNVCTRACGTCCARCNCVPPGTSGHRLVCGTCYANMKTHGGRLKCP
ncbi:Gibberellin-regulated protein 14 [Ranunculus cassubicifolius]